jgi:site-specific DNA recombinase
VHRLLDQLERDGIRSKPRVSSKGAATGDQPFSRGAMFHLLQNRVYVGDIVHKGQCYAGQHAGVVEPETFDRVQSLLQRQLRQRRVRKTALSPLAGRLFDTHGNRLTPTHSKNSKGETYRYYVPTRLQQGGRPGGDLKRFPARRVDALIGAALQRISAASHNPLEHLVRAELSPHSLELVLPVRMQASVRAALADADWMSVEDGNPELIRWSIPAVLQPRGGRAKVLPVQSHAPNRDPVLIQGLRAAHRLVERDRFGLPSVEEIPQSRYAVRLMRLALLSPRIQRDILAGHQPTSLRLEDLVRTPMPLCWRAQERMISGSPIRAETA